MVKLVLVSDVKLFGGDVGVFYGASGCLYGYNPSVHSVGRAVGEAWRHRATLARRDCLVTQMGVFVCYETKTLPVAGTAIAFVQSPRK